MKYSSPPKESVASFVAARILKKLSEGKKVLWLLSGGSSGATCVEVSNLLQGHDLSKLYVTMSDERYGPLNHPNENVAILIKTGLSLPGATFYRLLRGETIDETTASYMGWLQEVGDYVDYKIAVLGIGEDGHTCGVKPHSIAVDSTRLAENFASDDFKRITITLQYLRMLDEAAVQAYGETKHDVVRRLLAGEGDVHSSPMLAIRDIPNTTVFSDYKEGGSK